MSDTITGGSKAIEAIQQSAVKAAGVTIHPLPDRRTFLVAQGGVIEREGEIARPKIHDQVFSLASLAAAYTDAGNNEEANGGPICWHCGPPSKPRIVAVIDEHDYRECSLAMPLRLSLHYKQMVQMQEQVWDLTHRDLVRLLTHDWRDAVSKDFATVFRSVRPRTTSNPS